MGLSYLRLMQFADAKQAVQADLADQKPASLVVAAFANNALGKGKEAAVLAKDAIALAPRTAEAYYALALSAPDLKDQERAINRAIGYNTFQSGPYLDYAARLTISKRQDRYEQVLDLTDLVLKNEPDNLNAKLIQAQLYLFLKKIPDAESVLSQIGRMRGATANPDVQLTYATYWDIKGNGSQVNTALAEARKLDAVRFDQRGTTPPLELLLRLNRKMFYRSGYFLMPSTLFPQN